MNETDGMGMNIHTCICMDCGMLGPSIQTGQGPDND